jgi:hypothetical protein
MAVIWDQEAAWLIRQVLSCVALRQLGSALGQHPQNKHPLSLKANIKHQRVACGGDDERYVLLVSVAGLLEMGVLAANSARSSVPARKWSASGTSIGANSAKCSDLSERRPHRRSHPETAPRQASGISRQGAHLGVPDYRWSTPWNVPTAINV